MPYRDVRGVRLYYEERGQGSPLLCLPGALGTGATDFAPQLEELSQHFRVIAPDPRGYGKSRPPERNFPLDFIQRDCDDMAALMAALGCQSFAAAGWSDGATASALMAVTYPERISKLIIWGGNAYLSAEDMRKRATSLPGLHGCGREWKRSMGTVCKTSGRAGVMA
jgi:valacyclovir hydrolase